MTPVADVVFHEACRIVAADAEGGLRQVVGAEREEFRASAISSALRQARGSSIMVPHRYSILYRLFQHSASATHARRDQMQPVRAPACR
jgi:hypothetical protein